METFIGHIKTPQDALIVFEACRRGILNRVKRRLSNKERMSIKSGSIFAFDESEAGMRRWTDGRTWSPSRVLGSFLTYRELDTKRRPRKLSSLHGEKNQCIYKPNGLIKQSFSICTANNQKIHLISYYSKSDVLNGRLTLPTQDTHLSKIGIPKGLYPELNPLDTSGGHSATLHLLMNSNQQHYLNHLEDPRYRPPPSLSSSPLSTCSEDDILSPSHTSIHFPQQKQDDYSTHSRMASSSPKLPTPTSPHSSHPPLRSLPSTSSMLPPVQVWKPYPLQPEDTRQLEALKTQLRI
ncbi:unnamed protein product [Cunninghamella blakesleeana]